MTTDESAGARNPFEPPERAPRKPQPGDVAEGVLGRATKAIYWYLVLTVLLAVASLPGLVLVLFLAPAPSNIPLFALAGIPLGPALAAGLSSVRARYTDEDLQPAVTFWRGYRQNWLDTLRLWVPAVVLIGIIGYSIAFADVAGIGVVYRVVLGVIGTVLLVWAMHMLAITTFFRFRTRDVARLSAYYLLMFPQASFGVLALLIVAVAAVWLVGEIALVVVGGVWVWFWYRNIKQVLVDAYTNFTTSAG